jgi:hypothetical protein
LTVIDKHLTNRHIQRTNAELDCIKRQIADMGKLHVPPENATQYAVGRKPSSAKSNFGFKHPFPANSFQLT